MKYFTVEDLFFESTSFKWMFGETPIFHVKVSNHPTVVVWSPRYFNLFADCVGGWKSYQFCLHKVGDA